MLSNFRIILAQIKLITTLKTLFCIPLAAFPLPLLNVVDLSLFVNFNNIFAIDKKISKTRTY